MFGYKKLRSLLPIFLLIALIGGFFCADVYTAMAAENGGEMVSDMRQVPVDENDCRTEIAHDQGDGYLVGGNGNPQQLLSMPLIVNTYFTVTQLSNNDNSLHYLDPPFSPQAGPKPLGAVLRI